MQYVSLIFLKREEREITSSYLHIKRVKIYNKKNNRNTK